MPGFDLGALQDNTVSAYTAHLRNFVKAWRQNCANHQREQLIKDATRMLIADEQTNPREALAYQVIVAVDALARQSWAS